MGTRPVGSALSFGLVNTKRDALRPIPKRLSFGPMESFATDRLTAQGLAAGDLDDLVQLHQDPKVSRFLGGVRSADATASYLKTNLRHWSDHGFGLWVLRTADGAFAGRAGLRYIELEGARELEIAYALPRHAWAKGLATEIAQALVGLWKARLAEPSLVGVVMKGHEASERVLQKTGFVYERDAAFHDAQVGVFRQRRRSPWA